MVQSLGFVLTVNAQVDKTVYKHGSKLYAQHCQKCHDPLKDSDQKGMTAQSFNQALAKVKKKSHLKGVFNSKDIDALVLVLNSPFMTEQELAQGTTPPVKPPVNPPAKPPVTPPVKPPVVNPPVTPPVNPPVTEPGNGQGQTEPVAQPKTKADHFYAKNNPKLYNIARKYFPSDAAGLPQKRIYRLSRTQIDLSVRTLIPGLKVDSLLNYMSKDPLDTNYEYAEKLRIDSANILSIKEWYSKLLPEVAGNAQKILACSSPNFSEKCLQDGAINLATRAFRGDVSKELLTKIGKAFAENVSSSGFENAVTDLIEYLIKSPQFLFRAETTVDSSGKLSSTQYLQNLAYTFADAPPEKLGLKSSDAQKLVADPKAVSDTVYKIFSSKESREKLVNFFKAWLEIKDASEFTHSPQIFPEFSKDYVESMLKETDEFLRRQLYRASPSLKDITQPNDDFKNLAVKKIKSALGSNEQEPPRFGILSHPAVIASHSGPDATKLIKRGVFWVRKVMCMDLESAPPGLDINIPPLPSKGTERQRISKGTAPKSCIGCHKSIDQFGFFQEKFDALGRYRNKENGLDIDASMSLNFLDEGAQKTTTPQEALNVLTNSMMFKQCFVRQLFRFYMGRNEAETDHPLLRSLFYEFNKDNSQDVLKLVQLLGNSKRLSHREAK